MSRTGRPSRTYPAPMRVMGIVNVTPDSFSDCDLYLDPGKAVEKLESQIETIKANVEAEARAALVKLLELIDGKVPKKMLEEVRALANKMSGHFGNNQRFYEQCLTETKERLVAESKVEIDAMITAAVSNLGLESIAQLSAILSDPVQPIEMLKLMGPKP